MLMQAHRPKVLASKAICWTNKQCLLPTMFSLELIDSYVNGVNEAANNLNENAFRTMKTRNCVI